MCLMAVPLLAQQTQPQTNPADAPKTDKEKLSYSLGVNLARNLRGQKLDLDYPMIVRGLKDGISGERLLKDEEIQSIITTFYNDQLKKKLDAQRALAEKNKTEGAAFLEANKKKEGVIALPDGLQYKILKEGKGPKPKETDTVRENYRGTLIDGTEFDSSYSRNQPAVFPLDGVIDGWSEALQLMPVGSKWQVFIPAELAYGARQVGDKISMNSTLIFEVELLAIEPQADEEDQE
jgi:FKBP-type peptidyl-prolyl cis-trans isomerase FklB